MIRLWIYECKKICKSKINLLLILAMILGISYVTYEEYHQKTHLPVYPNQNTMKFNTFDGKPLTSTHELNSYAQDVLAKYEKMNDSKTAWEAYKNDYNHYYDIFTKKQDTNSMKKVYGSVYKNIPSFGTINSVNSLYDKVSNTLIDYSTNGEIITSYDEETDTAVLPAFYEKQAELHTLNYIYRNNPQASYIASASNQGNPYLGDHNSSYTNTPLYYFANKELLNEKIQNTVMIIPDSTKEIEQKFYSDKQISAFLHDKIMNTNFTFGSTFEMERFKYVLTKFTFFSLLLIAILLANSFSIESKTKTDQIITPTRIGLVKITLAKLFAGLSIAFSSFFIQLFCVMIISFLSLNMKGWSLSITSDIHLSIYTYAQYFAVKLQMLFTAVLAIAIVTMALSCILKNQFLTIVITFLFIMIPFFISNTLPVCIVKLIPSLFTTLDYLCPSPFYGIPYVQLFGNVYMWKDISVVFWLVVSVGLIIIMMKKARLHRVCNH